jgi:hypothetical protein
LPQEKKTQAKTAAKSGLTHLLTHPKATRVAMPLVMRDQWHPTADLDQSPIV